jgi:hypothetical protein
MRLITTKPAIYSRQNKRRETQAKHCGHQQAAVPWIHAFRGPSQDGSNGITNNQNIDSLCAGLRHDHGSSEQAERGNSESKSTAKGSHGLRLCVTEDDFFIVGTD